MANHSKKLQFPGSRGAVLAARLELPESTPRAYALFAHCFTCSKDVLAASRIARGLTEYGIAVLRFDFTDLGGSGGDFGNTNFSSNVDDLVHAADYLRTEFAAPTVLIGHSLGGAAVLAGANRIPETRAVATIGAPADPAHAAELFGQRRGVIEQDGHAEVELGGRTFCIHRDFLDDIAAQPQTERIATLGAALMVLHAPTDDIVGVDNARRIFEPARHPKSFVALDGADHLLTSRSDADFAAGIIASWAGRYVPTNEETPPEPTEGQVVVAETGAAFAQHINAGAHTLAADEPHPVGADTGPSPYDLLLSALGACTSMTVRMHADRKQWPLERVSVALRHAHIHAKDCAACESTTERVDHIERSIQLDGGLDDEQRRKLLDIADKCPVHRTLHSEINITTTDSAESPARRTD